MIEHGGIEEINPVDRWNGTPYDDAVRENHKECAKYLKSVGGMPGDMRSMIVDPLPYP